MKLKLLFTLAALLALAACKPPKFDQEIRCPLAKFHAKGVAVYDMDARGYVVVYPDGRAVRVSRESCVIEQIQ